MQSLPFLASSAFLIALTHTLLGPDHYLPFIALARARSWSAGRTSIITLLCGAGHVASSVVLGLVGLFFGVRLLKLEALEAHRGDIAAWFLLIFGFTYLVWGLHQAIKKRPHRHVHVHADGDEHAHEHTHANGHSHVHGAESKKVTPWVLFIIFVLGPCEPLIPLLMFPAAEFSAWAVVLIALIFSLTTLLTMLTVVLAAYHGLGAIKLKGMYRWAHPLAGLVILACGLAIFLGL